MFLQISLISRLTEQLESVSAFAFGVSIDTLYSLCKAPLYSCERMRVK